MNPTRLAAIASLGLLCGFTQTEAHAQGAVIFKNFGSGSNGSITPIAYVHRFDPIERLSGPGYTVQLYAGPLGTAQSSLQPVPGSARGFLTGSGAGLFGAPTLTIPGVAIGATAQLQVRVWDNVAGTVGTYEQASSAGLFTAKSIVLQIELGDPTILEPGAVPTLVGLMSFGAVVPEPATGTLALLGAGAFLFGRCLRKESGNTGNEAAGIHIVDASIQTDTPHP